MREMQYSWPFLDSEPFGESYTFTAVRLERRLESLIFHWPQVWRLGFSHVLAFWRCSMMRSTLTFVFSFFVVIGVAAWGGEAFAIKQFSDEFKALYAPVASPLADAKCNICHYGKTKKNRNVYGAALDKLLDKAEDKSNKDKIQKALETVAAMPSAGAGSPTFGEMIKKGELFPDE